MLPFPLKDASFSLAAWCFHDFFMVVRSGWDFLPQPVAKLSQPISNFTGVFKVCNIGFWQEHNTQDSDFLQKFELVPFRIFWAQNRLCYLHHLAHHGLTCHKTLLLNEFAQDKGWLREIVDDLNWFARFHALPFDIPNTRSHWIQVWERLRACPAWPKWVHRAVRKHVQHKKIAYEVTIRTTTTSNRSLRTLA